MKTLVAHRLFWPLVTLLLLLAINATFNPGFWQLQIRDGHLYGSVIDILNRAAPLAVVSLGMTLGFLAICMVLVWWIFRTGYRLKN